MRSSVWTSLIYVGAALAGFGLGLQVFAVEDFAAPRVLVLIAALLDAILAWSTALFWKKDKLGLSFLCLGVAAFLLPLAARIWG
ncbi:MAG: hypothetical protein RJA37_1529 [Verrucomicrobiota bacterium]